MDEYGNFFGTRFLLSLSTLMLPGEISIERVRLRAELSGNGLLGISVP